MPRRNAPPGGVGNWASSISDLRLSKSKCRIKPRWGLAMVAPTTRAESGISAEETRYWPAIGETLRPLTATPFDLVQSNPEVLKTACRLLFPFSFPLSAADPIIRRTEARCHSQ